MGWTAKLVMNGGQLKVAARKTMAILWHRSLPDLVRNDYGWPDQWAITHSEHIHDSGREWPWRHGTYRLADWANDYHGNVHNLTETMIDTGGNHTSGEWFVSHMCHSMALFGRCNWPQVSPLYKPLGMEHECERYWSGRGRSFEWRLGCLGTMSLGCEKWPPLGLRRSMARLWVGEYKDNEERSVLLGDTRLISVEAQFLPTVERFGVAWENVDTGTGDSLEEVSFCEKQCWNTCT